MNFKASKPDKVTETLLSTDVDVTNPEIGVLSFFLKFHTVIERKY